MERFVFETDIIVPRLELHRHRYEIDFDTMRQLLAGLRDGINELGIDEQELKQLLTDEGEISTVVAMTGKQDVVRRLIDSLARSAWLNDLPWKLDQAEGYGIDEARFKECVRAYIMPDDDHPLGVDRILPSDESNTEP